ncbi:MAG TPA: diaminopimelate epimerase [Candidatus Obscuribacterales bacterium]
MSSTSDKQAKPLATPFEKIHGLGNDFVVISLEHALNAPIVRDALKEGKDPLPELARRLCDRHYGIGGDGLIIGFPLSASSSAPPSSVAIDLQNRFLSQFGYAYPGSSSCDIAWIYINSDGSPSQMCGNGLRCLALWAVERKIVATSIFLVSTRVGPIKVEYKGPSTITVDLGQPILNAQAIPLAGVGDGHFIRKPIAVGSRQYAATCLSMGNPHCVIYMDSESLMGSDQKGIDGGAPARFPAHLSSLAPAIQALPLFPEGVNVEFAAAETKDRARLFVWERGCGPTLACASGAAATLVAGVLEGRLDRECEIVLPGGSLYVSWSKDDDRVRMTGPASSAFTGEVDLDHLLSLKQRTPSAKPLSQRLKEARCR